MASLSTDKNGNRIIQFSVRGKKRQTIRLGKMRLSLAREFKTKVEHLVSVVLTGFSLDGETSRWLGELDASFLEKLAAVGLVSPRESAKQITLGEFLDAYQKRRDDVKSATKTVYRHTIRNLLEVFGPARRLDSITPGDADDFRRVLQRRGDESDVSETGSNTSGVKLFDVAVVLLGKNGHPARELKTRWLESPKLPKPIGHTYQSRRVELYPLDKIVSFLQETEAVPVDGWDAIAERLRARLLKPSAKAKRRLSAVTVARRCELAKQFFRDAVRRKLITENPFEDVGGGPKANEANSHFVNHDTILKVIDACPNAEWRLLVALSRFGGLRIPSEALTLRWSDVDWVENRMTIHAPKTEHHIGKGTRIVPIFGELRPYLEDALEFRGDSEFVLPGFQREAVKRGDWRAVNLRTRFEKIVKRAGVTPWPRLWHNLRASRQTELEERFPSHVVCKWLGNSESVAKKHYLQTLDSHLKAAGALQLALQHTHASGCIVQRAAPEDAKTLGNSRVLALKLGDEGLEPPTSTV